ncbi:MAG: hypothetical protein QOD77_766 [Thermoplasmata archaeon]|jgi:hypothetical protein|nr:hypothetical protein [Thermoplasmata archaeon]
MLGRLVWFSAKLAVKYVLVPIAVTAVSAAVLSELAHRVHDKGGIASRNSRDERLVATAA